ncbi:hypothetical protein D3C81_530830 [compost metagenome]
MKGGALISVDQALEQLMLFAAQAPITAVEEVPLADADGRVLARDVQARIDSPLGRTVVLWMAMPSS